MYVHTRLLKINKKIVLQFAHAFKLCACFFCFWGEVGGEGDGL